MDPGNEWGDFKSRRKNTKLGHTGWGRRDVLECDRSVRLLFYLPSPTHSVSLRLGGWVGAVLLVSCYQL